MNNNFKIPLIIITLGLVFILGMAYMPKEEEGLGAAFTTDSQIASSTQFTLTTTSQRLLATSSRRIAVTIHNYNCTSANIGVFMNQEQDVAATVANADYVVFASSTDVFSVPTGNPITFEAVAGITDSGTCTVIVTEHRTR